MRLDNQINALQRRANKIIKVVNPPELKLHIFNESDYKDIKIPLAQSQWEMNIVIEEGGALLLTPHWFTHQNSRNILVIDLKT